ncbi:MAG: AAA family ATPase [Muribaculaceae bacterium]|nr:AAA family ATPase [Muribaculaceae bacterium]
MEKNLNSLLPPPSAEGVKTFLSGSFIKGIGKVYADRIFKKFGFEILSENFDFSRIESEVSGLGPSKLEEIKESFKALKYCPGLLSLLYSGGLSNVEVEKIISHYKGNTEKIISEDPYQIVEEVFKLSFFTADKLGKYMGIPAEDPRRIRGALLTAVKLYAEKGNMFATEEEAIKTASSITGVDKTLVSPEITELVKEERLVRSHKGLYLPVYYKAEKEGAEKLASLINSAEKITDDLPLPTTDREGHPLTHDQLKAISTVLKNPVTVITGGPGTGKSTTVRGVVKLLEDYDKKVILAAPTGRAAKRLSDLSGREAKTLHRLLGYSMGRGYKTKHIEADVLIIDEASMLEQVMFNHLLQALNPSTKIVLVGDVDQLPAIGAGDVLRDTLNSGTVPVISLAENFRQHEGSLIAAGASAIKSGKTPQADNNSDFMIISEQSPQRIHDRLISLVADELPGKFGITAKDIQVVTPQQEGPLGAKQLNLDIQKRVNPDAIGIRHGMKYFSLGDRVMQTSNSSIRKTYNGETGWISQVSPEEGWIEVTFNDGKISRYLKNELKELSLAYATTVHKLQGSETDYMVMPVSMSHRAMLYRNLLYTGVSRAKKMCVLVGEEKAIKTAIDNPSPSVRNSNFKKRLQEHLPVKYHVI